MISIGEALKILNPPLVFGNQLQINAVRFIERVDVARELASKCQECEGQPIRYDVDGDVAYCHCMSHFSSEVCAAAFD